LNTKGWSESEKKNIQALTLIFDKSLTPHITVALGSNGLNVNAALDLGSKFSEINSKDFSTLDLKKTGKQLRIKTVYSEKIYDLCTLNAMSLGDVILNEVQFLDSKDQTIQILNFDHGKTITRSEPVSSIVLGNSIFLDKVVRDFLYCKSFSLSLESAFFSQCNQSI